MADQAGDLAGGDGQPETIQGDASPVPLHQPTGDEAGRGATILHPGHRLAVH